MVRLIVFATCLTETANMTSESQEQTLSGTTYQLQSHDKS